MTEAKAPKLKPCPLCGEQAKRHTCLGNRLPKGPPWYETKYRVSCSKSCHCSSKPFDEQVSADLDWNTRADIHDALVKAADELAKLILEECDAGTEFESEWDTDALAALTAYRKARGETQ